MSHTLWHKGWVLISIICLFLSVYISYRIIFPQDSNLFSSRALIVVAFTALYYPVLPFLERGQIDAVTMILLILGIRTLVFKSGEFRGGVLFAIGTLLKLHIVYLVPFLFIRRKWKALAGYLTAGILIVALSIIGDGVESLKAYLTVELPRIAKWGENGTIEMRLPQNVIQGALENLPADHTIKNGRIYQFSSLEFVGNASLVRTRVGDYLMMLAMSLEIDSSATIVSAVLFLFFFLVMFLLNVANKFSDSKMGVEDEFSYWLGCLTLILLCAPLIWVMNTIWLIPVILVVLYQYNQFKIMAITNKERKMFCAYLAGVLGVAIMFLPDTIGFPGLLLWHGNTLEEKYVLGEIMIFIWLIVYLHRRYYSSTKRKTVSARL